MSAKVLAGGGVLWRHGPDGGVRIAVVHRPRYDDWSLPKGKLDKGEQPLAAACREVREETGFDVVAERGLGSTTYRVLQGGRDVAKRVDWWAVRATRGHFEPHAEVDALEWLDPDKALARLTTEGYGAPLRRFLALPRTTATVLVVRHARAGSRDDWEGDDDDRPLDDVGRLQARALCDLLTHYAPRRVLSAPLRRCVDTVQPLAQHVGDAVELTPALADAVATEDRERTAEVVRALVDPAMPTVVCSQGDTIPDLVHRLVPPELLVGEVVSRKGSVWALSFGDDGQVVDACLHAPPVTDEQSDQETAAGGRSGATVRG